MITVVKSAGIVAVGILFGFLLRANTTGKTAELRIVKSYCGHFTGVMEDNLVVLVEPEKGSIDSNYIAIFQQLGEKRLLIWKSPPAPVWDIFLTDIDGDRVDELAVCLFKPEPRDPRKDNRIQIYGWKHDTVHALWRGTFLSKPFEKIAFGDVTGDNALELISIERGRLNTEKVFLCVYRWNGFGFDLLAETGLNESPDNLIVTGNTHCNIELKYHSRTVSYFFSDNSPATGDKYCEKH